MDDEHWLGVESEMIIELMMLVAQQVKRVIFASRWACFIEL